MPGPPDRPIGNLSATVRRWPLARSISVSRVPAASATTSVPQGVKARPSGSARPLAAVVLLPSARLMRTMLPAASVTNRPPSGPSTICTGPARPLVTTRRVSKLGPLAWVMLPVAISATSTLPSASGRAS